MGEWDFEKIIQRSKDICDPASAARYLEIEIENAERMLAELKGAQKRQRMISFKEGRDDG